VASTCGLRFTDFGVVQTGSRLSDSARLRAFSGIVTLTHLITYIAYMMVRV